MLGVERLARPSGSRKEEAVAQAREDRTAAVVDDYDAICRVLNLCTEGEAKGDVAKLREAFHAEARMFGSLAGERFDVPIEELFSLAEGSPADTGNYRSRVLSVQQTGDAAVGVVAEEGYWGTVSFIDYFLLARIGGEWKIVSKLFAHTAGEPPEGI
jgi:Putative lumazine-binding